MESCRAATSPGADGVSCEAASTTTDPAYDLQWLLEAVVAAAAETARPPHTPHGLATSRFPVPSHLRQAGYEHTVNIGVLGAPGSGCSSLINALRHKGPRDRGAAPVGSTRTTKRPTAYALCGEGPAQDLEVREGSLDGNSPGQSSAGCSALVRLWDLPGVPSHHSMECTCRDLGLRYYDAVVVVCARRVTQGDQQLVYELACWGVPHFFVRTKVDIDMKCEANDHGLSEGEAIQHLRDGLDRQGLESIFLVSARKPGKYELQRLLANLLAAVRARRRPADADKDFCPVCGCCFSEGDGPPHTCRSCEAEVCDECTGLLMGERSEAHCPCCNEPSAISNACSWWWWWWPTWRWLWLVR
mmetsp:Transcript_115558/g.373348  ORF Transcript_115558/g.373348 Transcript_115558/m.373348 type:complete len:358 (-) Transcript_115558:133-1206(-)